jgi:hypothetical protein
MLVADVESDPTDSDVYPVVVAVERHPEPLPAALPLPPLLARDTRHALSPLRSITLIAHHLAQLTLCQIEDHQSLTGTPGTSVTSHHCETPSALLANSRTCVSYAESASWALVNSMISHPLTSP